MDFAGDRISQLPEPIKHHIMSFLPYRDELRTGILSKTWQNARASYPILIFLESRFEGGDLTRPTKTTERKLRFMDMVENSILKFYKRGMTLQRFVLQLVLPEHDDHNLGLRVDNWLELVSEAKVKELSLDFKSYYALNEMNNRYRPHCNLPQIIFGSKSLLTYLMLRNCTIEHLVFHASTRCDSLRELLLGKVNISDDILQKILLCCSSSLIRLELWYCLGVKNLRLSGLNKLKKVTVVESHHERLESIEIEAPSLCYFHCHVSSSTRISLVACANLEELSIPNSFVWEKISEYVGSKFQLLKKLCIDDCSRLRRIKISSRRLERLSLRHAQYVTEAIIQTPSLSSFRFDGDLSSISSFLTNTSRQCETRLVLNREIHVRTLWFVELKAFLTRFGIQNIHVMCFSCKVTFNWEDVRDISFPPTCHVKHLELDSYSDSFEGHNADGLLDGLLWSCRPETLWLELIWEDCRIFAKVLCEKLLNQNNRESCCGSSPAACWVHCLKDVKIALLAGSDEKALNCHSLSQALPTLTESHKISFNFKW